MDKQKIKKWELYYVIVCIPLLGFFSYCILYVLLSPFLTGFLSVGTTKLLVFGLSLIILIYYWKSAVTRSPEPDNKLMVAEFKASTRTGLLICSVLAFFMAAFGFSGGHIISKEGPMPPILGGIGCLLFGIVLLVLYFKKPGGN